MVEKTTIEYGGKKKKVPKKYVGNLKGAERKKQAKSIIEGKDTTRPKTSAPSKRSSHVIKFENKYNTKITNDSFISKNIISKTGIDKILSKGRGAFRSAGSRPNTSMESWARARLASVIMGGKARAVDKDIWEKYKK